MPSQEAPSIDLGNAPENRSIEPSPSPSEISSASSLEPQNIRATPLFRALAMPPPEPEQPPGQDELERRLPGYRRIVIPRELTLIELLKQSSGVTTDEEVLLIREAKLRVVAERVGLRRLHVLAPRLRSLTLDGSALSSLRDLGIGLVHLKILSVNRCSLTCLDGVWGLGALRELHASGNRLQDLNPLAALQKLHTLNLADNPIAESGRLWTLAVCSSLRHLTLRGTPMADAPDYRSRVAMALPMLVSLDDCHLNADEGVEDSLEAELGIADQDSNSDSDHEEDTDETAADTSVSLPEMQSLEPEPTYYPKSPESIPDFGSSNLDNVITLRRRRPHTTECAGVRPRPCLPPRPKTAAQTTKEPSKLHILNTLMDEEWRCSGSKLTSHGAVCGNLARALRRPSTASRKNLEADIELVKQSMEEASRAIAAEIPRAPCLEDWDKFRQETGINIEIDFNERPKEADASEAMDRLERIERETFERLNEEEIKQDAYSVKSCDLTSASTTCMAVGDYELWTDGEQLAYNNMPDPRLEVDALFNDIMATSVL